ncbi:MULTISPECIES: TetR/AcrR family transcriptional regulator [unclassified Chelatococcus]|uniref:TetR/AcrR family transcriptional regulator n=1 Tax=unclassified Chelatococcus TaxID=2638111 RepID=UPI001BD14362|nr:MULTISPECIES: TetR/AcrR family transcriptional regulator [unclassified Chelatococcus]CAH1660110.1 TetR family transcriptional regulator [Hyphomicrobiales bacterium]MBS7741047.1 TetR/AcrR family transcriptional regulator [Chelatococcus sp. HY11]MBX3545233.1 TetR/AcrR family transcriptional regulator [Chelatococcus sp.]MCO5077866.1 TetR/AcrR family transcriptional regulator [Chelatococcus sp.]CAH1683570.1 TetR family transcriptional regulator [Hyphomicrobiales bacterium]
MSWSKKDGPRGYHHGNLREALMQAALDLINEKGTAGATFAEAARRAGVSPAAPYRHFRDRDELLAAVAASGFAQFAEALQTAWNQGQPHPAQAFERMGKAYLAFARDNPALYVAMFESGLPADASAELQQAAERAFGVLRSGAEALVATMPAPGRPPALMVALHIWSMAHGVASLFGRADAARRKVPMAPEDLLEAGFLIYLKGLGGAPE